MLYGYPVAAVADNWVHESLCFAISSIHESLDAGESVPNWPNMLPDAYRARLESRTGLRDRLRKYAASVEALDWVERARVLRALSEQNEIALLVSCLSDCDRLDDLAEPIRQAALDLFGFAFRLLTGLGIRDSQYTCIYENAQYRLCPFCGCEYFDAPGAPREALDHYLSYGRYPFAAVNLRNLVPMGNKCNSRYKLSQDILQADDGVRRRSFYPYGEIPEISMSLDDSIPFAGRDGELPRWEIRFDNELEEIDTWLTVFSIRERYTRDVLDEGFKSWLREFSFWCRSFPLPDTENETLIEAVSRYEGYLSALGLNDRAFLKSAVFRMLHKRCRDGNERLLEVVRDLVSFTGAIGHA